MAKRQTKEARVELQKQFNEDLARNLSAEISRVTNKDAMPAQKHDCKLLHIENTITWLLENEKNNQSDINNLITQRRFILLFFFLGYLPPKRMSQNWHTDCSDWETTKKKFWDEFKRVMKPYDQSEADFWGELNTKFESEFNLIEQHFEHSVNATQREALKTMLRKISVNYFTKYYNSRQTAIAQMKKPYVKRLYPEFEYWLWAALESLTGNKRVHNAELTLLEFFDIHRYENQEHKALGLESWSHSTPPIKSNIAHVFKYFCENYFETIEARNMKMPFVVLFVYVLFNYDLLYTYLEIVHKGVLHDPKNPRDFQETHKQAEKRRTQGAQHREQKQAQVYRRAFNADAAATDLEILAVEEIKLNRANLDYKKLFTVKKLIYDSFAIRFPDANDVFRNDMRRINRGEMLYLCKANPSEEKKTLFSELDFFARNYDSWTPDKPKYEIQTLKQRLLRALQIIYESELNDGKFAPGEQNFFNDPQFNLVTVLVTHKVMPDDFDKWNYAKLPENLKNFFRKLGKTVPIDHQMLKWIAICLETTIFLVVSEPEKETPLPSVVTWFKTPTPKTPEEQEEQQEQQEQVDDSIDTSNRFAVLASVKEQLDKDIDSLQSAMQETSKTTEKQTVWLQKIRTGAKVGDIMCYYESLQCQKKKQWNHPLFILWEKTKLSSNQDNYYVLKLSNRQAHEESIQLSDQKEQLRIEQEKIQKEAAAAQMELEYRQQYNQCVRRDFFEIFKIGEKPDRSNFDHTYNYSIELKYMIICAYYQWYQFAMDKHTCDENAQKAKVNKTNYEYESSVEIFEYNLKQKLIVNIYYTLTGTGDITLQARLEFLQKGKVDVELHNNLAQDFLNRCLNQQKIKVYLEQLINTYSLKRSKDSWTQMKLFCFVIEEIVQYWCAYFCSDEQWKDWTRRILGTQCAQALDEKYAFDSTNLPNTARQQASVIILYYRTDIEFDKTENCWVEKDDTTLPHFVTNKLEAIKQEKPKDEQTESEVQTGNAPFTDTVALPVWMVQRKQVFEVTEQAKDSGTTKVPERTPVHVSEFPPIKGVWKPKQEENRMQNKDARRQRTHKAKQEENNASGNDVTKLPHFATLLDSIMDIIKQRELKNTQQTADKSAKNKLLKSILTILNYWIFSEKPDTLKSTLVDKWCEQIIQGYYRQESRSILNGIYCNAKHRPTKSDYEALKVHVINISSSVLARVAGSNQRTWKKWIANYIPQAHEVQTAIHLIRNSMKTDQNVSPCQILVQRILLDDGARNEFLKLLETTRKSMFDIQQGPQKRTYKDSVRPEPADFDLPLTEENPTEEQSDGDHENEDEHYDSDHENKEKNRYELRHDETVFETQEDGHSLFSAVAQALYRYPAVYQGDNKYTKTGDNNVHYSHDTKQAIILRKHINELRHAVAWTSLEYTRAEARGDNWYKNHFGNSMTKSLSDMWKYYNDMLHYAGVDTHASFDRPFPPESWGASYAVQLLAEYIERPICVYEQNADTTDYNIGDKYVLDCTYQPLVTVHNKEYKPMLLVRRENHHDNTTHYDVIVKQADDVHWQRERHEWRKGQGVRKIMRLFQYFFCWPQTYTWIVNKHLPFLLTPEYFMTSFTTRKWDNIFAQLRLQITDLENTYSESEVKTIFWRILSNLAIFAETELLPESFDSKFLIETNKTQTETTLEMIQQLIETFLQGPYAQLARLPALNFFKYTPVEWPPDKLEFFKVVRFGEWIYAKMFEIKSLNDKRLRKITGCLLHLEDETKTELQFQFDNWFNSVFKHAMSFEQYLEQELTEKQVDWRQWLIKNYNEIDEGLTKEGWDQNIKEDKDVLSAQQQVYSNMQEQFEYATTHPCCAQETHITLDVDSLASVLKHALQQAEELCLLEEDKEDTEVDADEESSTAVQMQFSTLSHANYITQELFTTEAKFEWHRLNKFMSINEKQFRIFNVDPDGNCFYYNCWLFSLVPEELEEMMQLVTNDSEVFAAQAVVGQQEIRKQISKWLLDNKDNHSWLQNQTIKTTCVTEFLDVQIAKMEDEAATQFHLLNQFIGKAHERENLLLLLEGLKNNSALCEALKVHIKRLPYKVAFPKEVQDILDQSKLSAIKELTEEESSELFEQFCNGIKNEDWGGQVSAYAFEKRYKKNVIILDKKNFIAGAAMEDIVLLDTTRPPNSSRHDKTVYFLYNNDGNHYDCLIPVDYKYVASTPVYKYAAPPPAHGEQEPPAHLAVQPERPTPAIAPTPEPPAIAPTPEPPAIAPTPEPPAVTQGKRATYANLTHNEKVKIRRRKLIYQAFIDLFCCIYKEKQIQNKDTIGHMATHTHKESLLDISSWMDLLDNVSEFWSDMIVLFCKVCDCAQETWSESKNYEWTWKKDMIVTREHKSYHYLPNFKISFFEAENSKKSAYQEAQGRKVMTSCKYVFVHHSTRWFNKLRRQTTELWMQHIFTAYPIAEYNTGDATNSPYFQFTFSKEEIARYAEGSVDENHHRYCFPKNCYKQLENNVDVSTDQTKNPELWRFRDKFFSNDKNKDGTPAVTHLCVALFRLRKICAFIREAKEYQEKDPQGNIIGQTEKIKKELRDTIKEDVPDSQFVKVLAANMQRSINEFLV